MPPPGVASKLNGTQVAGTLLLLFMLAAPSTLAFGAEPGCTQKGDETRRITIQAAEVMRCIISGKPIDLDRVEILGALDLEKIPITKIVGKNVTVLPGMPEPRAALELDALEKDLGRFVPGVRLVKDRFNVQNSNIDAILGPRPNPHAAAAYAPVVFLQLVNLHGTTVQGDISAPHTRFRLPVIATNLVVKGIVDFTSSTFAANVLFDDVVFYDQASFAQVHFSGSPAESVGRNGPEFELWTLPGWFPALGKPGFPQIPQLRRRALDPR